jgi:hypothetical protein
MEAQAKKQRAITSTRVDPNKPASVVIDRFGGLTRFCALTGYPTSTAHGWTVSGYIPAHRKGVSIHTHILGIAEKEGVPLLPAHFVEAQPTTSFSDGSVIGG